MICAKQGMLDFFVKLVMNMGSIEAKSIIILMNILVKDVQELGIQYLFFA